MQLSQDVINLGLDKLYKTKLTSQLTFSGSSRVGMIALIRRSTILLRKNHALLGGVTGKSNTKKNFYINYSWNYTASAIHSEKTSSYKINSTKHWNSFYCTNHTFYRKLVLLLLNCNSRYTKNFIFFISILRHMKWLSAWELS